jgi:hypothetical protein
MLKVIFFLVSFLGALVAFSFGWALCMPLAGCAAVLALLELQARGVVGR